MPKCKCGYTGNGIVAHNADCEYLINGFVKPVINKEYLNFKKEIMMKKCYCKRYNEKDGSIIHNADCPKDYILYRTKNEELLIDNKNLNDKDYKELIDFCMSILDSKGKDYTLGSEDKLHNFREVAEFCGVTKEQVLGIYLYKQMAAVFSYIKTGGQSESEPIKNRLADVINYCLLAFKMFKENESKKNV